MKVPKGMSKSLDPMMKLMSSILPGASIAAGLHLLIMRLSGVVTETEGYSTRDICTFILYSAAVPSSGDTTFTAPSSDTDMNAFKEVGTLKSL